MRKPKRFLSVLCAACMILALAVPAFAAEIQRSATQTTTVPLIGDTQKIFDFPVARGYGYWKIAIGNKSSADCWFAITKESPSGEVIYTSSKVSANSTLSFRSAPDRPLTDGTYYVTVHSARGDTNLNGTLWYKFGTTFHDISD